MATSKLQRKVSEVLSAYFSKYTIRENYRPCWLISKNGARLELDFFVEELEIALEIQGEQHYKYVEFFHKDEAGFLERKDADRRKKEACNARGIKLFEIFCEQDIYNFIKNYRLRKSHNPREVLIEKRINDKHRDSKKIADVARFMVYHFLEFGIMFDDDNLLIAEFYKRHKKNLDLEFNRIIAKKELQYNA